MATTINLGYPRIGEQREIKRALEAFWKGKKTEEELLEASRQIKARNWKTQQDNGIQQIPSNDFSFYDHVLDTIAMFGAVPERYEWNGDVVDIETYFMMARGGRKNGKELSAMEMTKWFDTNYHYIVPEFSSEQQFRLSSLKALDDFQEAKALGIHTRPVLVGPISFLLLGKSFTEGFEPLSLLERVLPVYVEMLKKLADAGADWVQIDEPCLVLELPQEALSAYQKAYNALHEDVPQLQLALTSYFGPLKENLDMVLSLPVQSLHLDLVRAPEQLDDVLSALPKSIALSLGLVNGRNVWRCDLSKAREQAQKAVDALGSDRVLVGPSCSLLFSPIDVEAETELDPDIRSWLAFAKQKLGEIAAISRSLNEGPESVKEIFEENKRILQQRQESEKTHNVEVKSRLAGVNQSMLQRQSSHVQRKMTQQQALNLPLLPSTTIGSFPQTPEIRKSRLAWKKGNLSTEDYEKFMKKEIAETVKYQEEIGLDVLVHGEAERTDMVEYFGFQLEGFAFSKNGWVQSYGSRCVRPPIIYGDVSRPEPMTVTWSVYAQSLTSKAMKGMLTGPVTILEWSFVRDDQPRSATCNQIALALRDEVQDLESAGITVIQIDEPALREGLPLRRAAWAEYLEWSVNAFRLSAAGVADSTQIHTHMCYAEFNDIIGAIEEMDADVISIESTRSKMELLDAFIENEYANDIGPGIYDIHSPRIPHEEEYEELLRKALQVFKAEQIWVNPDCGLKTRRWEEVKPALERMVKVSKKLRRELG
ncbi:MAG: 5-methyltetrahydropteroyltriglutamate--homocysteine S-methyltransferase [bacterium]|nr:5-methyltetrahydropteroyltriglutamate--homocysteine S-methyltransferase [bacterium]